MQWIIGRQVCSEEQIVHYLEGELTVRQGCNGSSEEIASFKSSAEVTVIWTALMCGIKLMKDE